MRIEKFLKMPESEMGALQTLRLTYAGLYQLDAASFQAFCNAIAHCHNLQQLNLEYNNLGCNYKSGHKVSQMLLK